MARSKIDNTSRTAPAYKRPLKDGEAEKIERKLRAAGSSLVTTMEEAAKQGKQRVQLSPNMVIFSDKSRDELLEIYKHTNNIFNKEV